MGGAHPTKYLPDGSPNPLWRKRPSGKAALKFMPDGSLNPKWKPPRAGAHVAKSLPDGAPNPKFVPYRDRPIAPAPVLDDLDKRLLDLSCLNCDRLDWIESAQPQPDEAGTYQLADLISGPKGSVLYCSEYCEQEATYVRYARRVTRDGRIDRVDVREALEIRRALLLGGGYPAHARHLSDVQRYAAFAADGGKCRKCGSPATDIDHIGRGPDGRVNDPANLQALCKGCHDAKTVASFVAITPDDPRWEATAQKVAELARRVGASTPERTSDDEGTWTKIWSRVKSARRQRLMTVAAR